MWGLTFRIGVVFVGFLVTLLLIAGFGYCENTSVEVIGIGECSDCMHNSIKSGHAFSGLRVAISCKVADGKSKTRGVSKLDEEGKFKVILPSDIVKDDGQLKEDCFAQILSASSTPCPADNGLEASKIIFKSKDKGKHIFSPDGKLVFSPITCPSAFQLPYFKAPHLPKVPETHPGYKILSKLDLPPLKIFAHPVVFPPLPVYKPKPLPPIYKKSVPTIPKLPPFPKLPPIPRAPLPPLPKLPPIPKTPLPPLPKLPPINKKPFPPLPPIPKIPPIKDFPPLPELPPLPKLPPLPMFPPFP